MKKTLILFLILPLLGFGQNYIKSADDRLGYAEILPAGYSLDTAKRWPVIIFLHGSGERGLGVTVSDLQKTIKNGPAKYKDGRFIVLCPQTNAWSWRSVRKVKDAAGKEITVTRNDAVEFTKWALQNYRIDKHAVYITGLSMGGEGCFFAMADAPQLYAAGAPIAGRASRTEGAKIAAGKVKVWAFHGSADTAIPIEGLWNAYAGYRSVDKSILLTVYPGVGHDSWTAAYKTAELYNWFLKNRKQG